jgi:hypothetical protein
VKNDGPNMPIDVPLNHECRVGERVPQQRSMASGVALMMRFITP